MNSIKNYLITSLLAIIVLAIFISSIQGYRKSMSASEKLFDAQLASLANLLVSISTTSPQNSTYNSQLTPHLAFQLWDANKKLIMTSQHQGMPSYSKLNQGYDNVNFEATRWRSLFRYFPQYNQWIWVAEKQSIRFELAEAVILESITPSLLIIPLIGLIILLVINYGMHPIKELATQISQKKANDLNPITIEEIPKELVDLTESVNQLFLRLDSSFKREKRLASDAAHELRTPIAALDLQVQNLIAELPENTDLSTLIATTKRLSNLVEQILTLNKTTPELFVSQMVAQDIAPTIRQVVAEQYALIEQKQQMVEMEANQSIIHTDKFAIETLVSNLLLNAIKYTPEKGKIKIKLFSEANKIIFEIHDNGPGIEPQLRSRVLERFYRLDKDRNNSQSIGCGLGLSIVQHITKLHHAKLYLLDSEFDCGLAVRVEFNSISQNNTASSI